MDDRTALKMARLQVIVDRAFMERVRSAYKHGEPHDYQLEDREFVDLALSASDEARDQAHADIKRWREARAAKEAEQREAEEQEAKDREDIPF